MLRSAWLTRRLSTSGLDHVALLADGRQLFPYKIREELPVILPQSRQVPNGVRSSRKPTFVVCDSASVRLTSEPAFSIDSDAVFRATRDHLKFSIAHTFLVPLASFMASDRPSGDGIANSMLLLEWSSTEALPSSVTLSNALSRS